MPYKNWEDKMARQREWRRAKAAKSPSKKHSEAERVEAFRNLYTCNPYLALRIMNVRTMMEHRDISKRDIYEHLGRSKEYVSGVLYPKGYLEDGTPRTSTNQLYYSNVHNRLDEVERAITEISVDKFGPGRYCGCTQEALREIKAELDPDGWIKEMYPDGKR